MVAVPLGRVALVAIEPGTDTHMTLVSVRRTSHTVNPKRHEQWHGLVVGSHAWQVAQYLTAVRNRKSYSISAAIKRAYRDLEDLRGRIERAGLLADGTETETGRGVSPLVVSLLDMEKAHETLATLAQRVAWDACIIGRVKSWDKAGERYEYVRLTSRMTYEDAAKKLDLGNAKKVTELIARASVWLEWFLCDEGVLSLDELKARTCGTR